MQVDAADYSDFIVLLNIPAFGSGVPCGLPAISERGSLIKLVGGIAGRPAPRPTLVISAILIICVVPSICFICNAGSENSYTANTNSSTHFLSRS